MTLYNLPHWPGIDINPCWKKDTSLPHSLTTFLDESSLDRTCSMWCAQIKVCASTSTNQRKASWYCSWRYLMTANDLSTEVSGVPSTPWMVTSGRPSTSGSVLLQVSLTKKRI